MLSIAEKNEVMKMIHEFRGFISNRKNRKFDISPAKGWLTMLKRENMLDRSLFFLKRALDD